MMQRRDISSWATAHLLGALALACVAGCNPAPTDAYDEDATPNYRSVGDPNASDFEAESTSGERGNMQLSEVNWAGSVCDGEWDPDDIFLEFQNKHPRPINLADWRLILEGDVVRTWRIPDEDINGEPLRPVQPNDFFVIVAKADGAFGEAADVVLPDMRIGDTYAKVELRDADRALLENAGSDTERLFAGGYDNYAVRSMERVQLIFGNQGGQSRSWHAFSLSDQDLRPAPQRGIPGRSRLMLRRRQAIALKRFIAPECRERTFASPGEFNSPDYSGTATSGGFE